MPAPAGAITVLLPFYIDALGLISVRQYPLFIAVYTLAMAFLLVSTIPTFSGKLMGERIRGELLLPILTAVAALVGLLVTYPYVTLSVLTIGYLAIIPLSYRRFRQLQREWDLAHPVPETADASLHGGLSAPIAANDVGPDDMKSGSP
jgi:CDP-diacylglycerol--serine O-phosphatidyltransferase